MPTSRRFHLDATTRGVMTLVRQHFADHFGELKSFGWAVTRKDALEALQHFTTNCLPQFGDYQDAMKAGQDFLFHLTAEHRQEIRQAEQFLTRLEDDNLRNIQNGSILSR